LTFYSPDPLPPAPEPAWLPAVRRRTSLRARLWKFVRRPSGFKSAAKAG
jgi:hypothetical protein